MKLEIGDFAWVSYKSQGLFAISFWLPRHFKLYSSYLSQACCGIKAVCQPLAFTKIFTPEGKRRIIRLSRYFQVRNKWTGIMSSRGKGLRL
jgi:hypothetical protein